MVTELTNTGCRVYISLYDDPLYSWLRGYYQDFLVNGGEFDWADIGAGTYPFTRLRLRILSEL